MANTFLDALIKSQNNKARTDKGDVAFVSTLDGCLDLFGSISSFRQYETCEKFAKAFSENPLTALKVLFYSRDPRGGQGQRSYFRKCLKHWAVNAKTAQDMTDVEVMIPAIKEFGRFDDIFTLLEDGVPDLIQSCTLDYLYGEIMEGDHYALKWFPREKSAKRDLAVRLRKHFKMSSKTYRQTLSKNSVVENLTCDSKWGEIDYSSVPSLAFKKYSRAFSKHDGERFGTFLTKVTEGKEKINASVVYPYQIFEEVSKENHDVANAMWVSLPDYCKGNKENILPLIDVSGSMMSGEPSCLSIAVSLGLYLSERMEGDLKDHFMTFSAKPKIVKVEGDTLSERLANIESSEWGYNTNIDAVFSEMLSVAKRKSILQSDMPTKIIIFSDMQFDEAVARGENSVFSFWKESYQANGYALPEIIFWNLNSDTNNFPMEFDENGTCLVSGFSPSLIEPILSCEITTPYEFMLSVINAERYDLIDDLWKFSKTPLSGLLPS